MPYHRKKRKITTKGRGPEVSIRKYQCMSGPSAFEVWIEKESVFCSQSMSADELAKILRKLGVGVKFKNLDDPVDYDIHD
jgi:hypothetical protein